MTRHSPTSIPRVRATSSSRDSFRGGRGNARSGRGWACSRGFGLRTTRPSPRPPPAGGGSRTPSTSTRVGLPASLAWKGQQHRRNGRPVPLPWSRWYSAARRKSMSHSEFTASTNRSKGPLQAWPWIRVQVGHDVGREHHPPVAHGPMCADHVQGGVDGLGAIIDSRDHVAVDIPLQFATAPSPCASACQGQIIRGWRSAAS